MFFEKEGIEKIAQNLKYDYKVLAKYDVLVAAPYFDTMLAHYLLEPDQRHNMDVLAQNYLNYNKPNCKRPRNQNAFADARKRKRILIGHMNTDGLAVHNSENENPHTRC